MLTQRSCIGFLLAVLVGVCSAGETRRIASAPGDDDVAFKYAQKYISLIYQGCDLDVVFLEFPQERSIFTAETGNIDGELARMKEVVSKDSLLVPVPTPLLNLELVPVRHVDDEPIHSSKDLEGKRVAYQRGFRIMKHLVPDSASAIVVNSTYQIFKLLSRGRVDIGLMMKQQAMMRFSAYPDMTMDEPILTEPIFHFVHERHAGDIPCLDRSLSKLIEDRTVERLESEYLPSTPN
ncbi:MAG: transporter substrate-binding domain-containing protein [Marinobacter sp.]|nr:transporter substrate-binding domain-containing protein [Marinobacter sp.]